MKRSKMQKCTSSEEKCRRDPASSDANHNRFARQENIEYDNVELYFCGIQTSFCTLSSSVASVLVCWILPNSYVASVRTLALCSVVALFGTVHPFKIQGAKGFQLIFNAMRPCPWIYLVALVLEQLRHTCSSASRGTDGFVPLLVFNALGISLAASGVFKSNFPDSSDDIFFVAISVLFVLMALFPTPVSLGDGPLCSVSSVAVAFERSTRAMLFAFLYSVFVYSTPPQKQTIGEICYCCIRATGGSVWVLVCSPWIFWLAPIQFVLAIWVRVRERTRSDSTGLKHEFDSCIGMQSTSDSEHNDMESGSAANFRSPDSLPVHAAVRNCGFSANPIFKIPLKQATSGSIAQRRSCCMDEKDIANALSAIPPGTFSGRKT